MKMHWTDVVRQILTSESGDLRDLARIAGFNPRTFYVNQDLGGCDLRGQDLRGLDLTGCNLDEAILDNATLIDPEFDPRVEDAEDYWKFSISTELNTMILSYMQEAVYTYPAWAYRSLIEAAISHIYVGFDVYYSDIINANSNLKRIISDRRKFSQINIKVLLYKKNIEDVEQIMGRKLSDKDGPMLLMIGLISRKIKHRDKRDFSSLSANAFYPPRLVRVEGSL